MAEPGTKHSGNSNIVCASWHDLRELFQMERTCFQLDAWPLLDVLGVLTFPQVIRLKAVRQQQIIGFIAADLRPSQRTAWIATLAVLPDFRQQGVGSTLLEACEARITLPKIRLSVRRSNLPAIKLYQKHGYQQVEIWKAYYRGADDALVYEKTLSTHGSP